MELQKILLQPESKTLEFKRDLSSIDPILKTLVAFANTAGGILVIGRDADGVVFGVKDILKAEEALANSIADKICPALLPELEMVTIGGKDLLVVKVSHWRAPFYLKKEGPLRGVYIRLGSTSRPASPELVEELKRSVLTLSFDQQPLSHLSLETIDLGKGSQIFKVAQKTMSEEKGRSLGVFTATNGQLVPSIGGLIVFGKKEIREQNLPDARVSCARFHGDTKANILDRYEVEGTIVDAVDEVPKFIARNTRLVGQIQGVRRRDVPEYSPIAVREALVNALVHADYSLTGSHIQVAIFSDRLEIQNPGMFPFGFTLDDLKAGISRVRNRVIARVFHALQFMEEWGSGYKRIIDACRQGGYPEPRWEELGMTIRVTFYPHSQASLPIAISTDVVHLPDREQLIMSLFDQVEYLPFREIAQRLPISISDRTLRYDLRKLKQKKVLTTQGKGRSLLWKKLKKE